MLHKGNLLLLQGWRDTLVNLGVMHGPFCRGVVQWTPLGVFFPLRRLEKSPLIDDSDVLVPHGRDL